MIQVFAFNVFVFCFWYVCDSFCQLLGLGFQTANQQTNTHMHSTSTSEYWNMSSKAERAYRSRYKKDAAFSQSSISLHPTPILSFHSLICGENTYCSFFSWWNKKVQKKNEKCQRLRSKKSEEVKPHTILAVCTYVVDTYILLSRTEL